MFQQLFERVKANKATTIKVASVFGGALLGLMIAAALTAEDDYLSMESLLEESVPDIPEVAE